jgi:hypothetical protein
MKILDEMDIPKSCKIGITITKTNFYNATNFTSKDKSIFQNNIKKIKLCYSLKEDNIRITQYKDKVRNYEEIEIIHISLKKINSLNRIADIIFRTIPYPSILIFQNQNNIQLFVAHKKEHLSDKNKTTVEDIISTDLIDLDNLDDIDKKLFKSLQLDNLSFSHFYKFYSDIVDNINIYNASKTVGKDLSVSIKMSPNEIKAIKDEIENIANEIKLKRTQINKETQFNKQTELNIQIHELKEEKKRLKAILTDY